MQNLESEIPIPVFHSAYDHGMPQGPPSATQTDFLYPNSPLYPHDRSTPPSPDGHVTNENSSTTRSRRTSRQKRAQERDHASRTREELVVLLISAEREMRKLRKSLSDSEKSRDEELDRLQKAERMGKDVAAKLRQTLDEKAQLQSDLNASHEEARVYKLQLEHSKIEVERAQRAVDSLTRQRNDAEQSASRARSRARKLAQERDVQSAREEGRRLGFESGFRSAQQEYTTTGRILDELPIGPRQPGDIIHMSEVGPGDESFIQEEILTENTQSFGAPADFDTEEPSSNRRRRESHARAPSQPQMPQAIVQPVPVIPAFQAPQPSRKSAKSRTAMSKSDHRSQVSPPISNFTIEIPPASEVGQAGNINPATFQPQNYTIPPDNYIPVGDADGAINMPAPYEMTPRPSHPSLPPATAPDFTSSGPNEASTAPNQPPQKRASWYHGQEHNDSAAKPGEHQNWYPPPAPAPKRRGTLLGTIGRLGAAALGIKKAAPREPPVKNRINLDSPDSDTNVPNPTETHPNTAPAEQSARPPMGRPLVHQRSQSDDLQARLASMRADHSQAPSDAHSMARSRRSKAESQRVGRGVTPLDDGRYSRTEAIDKWRKEGSIAGSMGDRLTSPRSNTRRPPNALGLSTPKSRTSSKYLYVANQSEADLAELASDSPPTGTSGGIGIKIEPASSTSHTTPHTLSQGPFGGYYNTSGAAISTGSASGRKTPRPRAASISGPLHPALQAASQGGNEVPAVRRIPSKASIRSDYSGPTAHSGHYGRFNEEDHQDIVMVDLVEDHDTPTRQNTSFNAGLSAGIPSQYTPSAGRPRSIRSLVRGTGPGSSATSMYEG